MNQKSFPLPAFSRNDERKQALFKVYSLLIKLAEEVEEKKKIDHKNSKDEKSLSAPLQKNIPS